MLWHYVLFNDFLFFKYFYTRMEEQRLDLHTTPH
jgi:hypothetical protein